MSDPTKQYYSNECFNYPTNPGAMVLSKSEPVIKCCASKPPAMPGMNPEAPADPKYVEGFAVVDRDDMVGSGLNLVMLGLIGLVVYMLAKKKAVV